LACLDEVTGRAHTPLVVGDVARDSSPGSTKLTEAEALRDLKECVIPDGAGSFLEVPHFELLSFLFLPAMA
jgi:hypothetical protein